MGDFCDLMPIQPRGVFDGILQCRIRTAVRDDVEPVTVAPVLGNTALVTCLLIFLTLYIRRFRSDWAYTTANVNVVGLPLVLVLLLARVVHLVLPGETHQYRNTSNDSPMVMICAVPKEYE